MAKRTVAPVKKSSAKAKAKQAAPRAKARTTVRSLVKAVVRAAAKVVKKAKRRAAPGKAKAAKYVYYFGDGKADGDRTMKDTLGGKGSGLAEMTNAGLPVPAGFTISTGACNLYYANGGKLTPAIEDEIVAQLRRLEKSAKATLGSSTNPLLVSVRSGAKFSMPGMMDTILNLGLNDQAVEGLKARTGNGRFAYDSYRRFIQMFGSVVLEIPKSAFEHEFEAVKTAASAALDTDLDEAALREVHTVQGAREDPNEAAVSAGPARPAPHVAQRRVPVVEQPASQGVPPYLRHSGRHRHGGQRADDGVWQHGRPLGDRRRVYAQPGHRCQGVLRRVPGERAG